MTAMPRSVMLELQIEHRQAPGKCGEASRAKVGDDVRKEGTDSRSTLD